MPNSSVLAAATKNTITSKPCNYGINHITWDEPSGYSPWISMRLLKKFGGPSTSEKDGVIIYEKDSNNYIFAPTAVGSTGVGTFSYPSSGAGMGTATLPSSTYITNFTYTNGGAITLTSGTTTAGVKSYSINTVYFAAATSFTNVSATGGSGTGAKFNISISGYVPGSGYTASITVASAGTGYAIGDTLTIPTSSMGGSSNASAAYTLTVTAITTTVSQTYTVTTTTTSGSGTGAVFIVTRSGTSGTNNAYVTYVQLVSGGSGYAVNDTVTINGTATGGTSGTNNITVTVTGVAASTAVVTQTYTDIAQSSTSGSGTGATFDIYRTGTAGTSVGPYKVVVRNKGTGYSVGNTITINGANIGGTTGSTGNLVITVSTTDGGGGLLASSANYVTGSAFTSRYSGTSINTPVALVNQKSQTYTGVPVFSAKGSGRGAAATVVRNSSGAISTVTITTSGTGYAADDLLVIPASYIGDYKTDRDQLGVDADFHVFDNFYPPYQVATRTTGNISNLSLATRTLDGYTYGLNDLVLVANQTTAANNGLYKATSVASTTAVLTKQTSYDGSDIHVINGTTNGGRAYSNSGTSFTQKTAPVVNPGKDSLGNNTGGKEVYYTLYVRTVSVTGTNTGTVSWGSLGYITDTYVEDTGMHQWLIDHLPSWYFEGSTDLSDFLALFAFHLEVYKQSATSVFDMSDPLKTPEKLIKAWLSEFGTDYHLATDSKSARKLLTNIVETYSKKGSISGIDLISESITGLPATITTGVNLLPDINTASFEQSLGFWTPRLTSTSPTITFSGVSTLGVLGISLQNGPVGSLAPYGTGTTAVTGMAKVVNNTGSSPQTIQYQIGPRRATSTTSSKITQQVSPQYYLYYLSPDVAENGDYVVSVDSDKQTYLKPGTTTYSVTPTTNTAYISDPPVTSDNIVPEDAMYYFSKTGSDITSVLAEFLPITPTSTYVFSMAFGFPTGGTARAVSVGIEWIDVNGNSISSTSTTLASAAQSANTWYRIERSGTAPANAVYASPYFAINSMANTDTGYYVDAAQFELGSTASAYEDPRLVTISIPSSTTAQRENISAVLGNYIPYGQGPVGTSGATITGVSASIERIGQESPITYPTAYSATGTALTLTVPTGHGFAAGDEIITADLTSGGTTLSTANTVASITSTTDTTIVFSNSLAAGSGSISKGSVSKLKGYNFIYTSTTPHGMVPGHQITVTGLTPTDLNLSTAMVIGTPTAYEFVVGFSSTTAVITSTVTSGSGTVYVDFGRSGSTRVTS